MLNSRVFCDIKKTELKRPNRILLEDKNSSISMTYYDKYSRTDLYMGYIFRGEEFLGFDTYLTIEEAEEAFKNYVNHPFPTMKQAWNEFISLPERLRGSNIIAPGFVCGTGSTLNEDDIDLNFYISKNDSGKYKIKINGTSCFWKIPPQDTLLDAQIESFRFLLKLKERLVAKTDGNI